MSEMKNQAPRRKFLKGAAVGTAGAAALSFPMISKSQGVQNLRFQSTWPAKDIFHEYALDFAKKVNDMTGGEMSIEVLKSCTVSANKIQKQGFKFDFRDIESAVKDLLKKEEQ